MTGILTAAGMRAVERAAIESGSVTGGVLMERAGKGVVDAVLETWPALAWGTRRALVLCGPGNNGGDGFVVARLLCARGWRVEVRLLGDPEALPPDARVNCAAWQALGEGHPLDGVPEVDEVDLVVDAVFGLGLSRPVGAPLDGVFAGLNDVGARVVAVDIASGLHSDTGAVPGAVLRPGLTVTFHAPKAGHYLAEDTHVGTLRVVDIGLSGGTPDARLLEAPRDLGKAGGHKYAHGHALVLAGGVGRGGAARLAARTALRIGAGLVTLGCPPAALIENAAQLNAVMLRRVDGAEALAAMLAEESRLNALGLGPGLGTGEGTRALAAAALEARRATVLDADALTAFADDPGALFARLHPGCVLTPHGGEFARLFPDIAGDANLSKIEATRAAAARAGCTVLHKGPATVIADADGAVALCHPGPGRGVPWLATAGAGDVLTGMIAGLLARGFAPAEAAGRAAWLHQACARALGPGLIAEDLPEALPGVLRDLGA